MLLDPDTSSDESKSLRQARTSPSSLLAILDLLGRSSQNPVVVADVRTRVVWHNRAFARMRAAHQASGATNERVGQALIPMLDQLGFAAPDVERLLSGIHDRRNLRLEMSRTSECGPELLRVDLQWVEASGDQAEAEGACGRVDGTHRLADGEYRHPSTDLHCVLIMVDVSELGAQRELANTILNVMPNGVVVRGRGGAVLTCNPAGYEMLGLSLEQIRGEKGYPDTHVLDADLKPLTVDNHPSMRALATGRGVRDSTMVIRRTNGGERWLQVNAELMRDADGKVSGVVSCYSDVTEQKLLELKLARAASTDDLTLLPNRAEVFTRIQRLIARADRDEGQRFALLFMDCDHFSHINDAWGHSIGDGLLRQIAIRLDGMIDEVRLELGIELDAGRPGGDEFVILAGQVRDEEHACALATRILQRLCLPYAVRQHVVHTTFSIGIVMSDAATGRNAQDLMRDADVAMYEAKRAGRRRFQVFRPEMQARLMAERALEADLREAMNGDEQLTLAFQPVVDLVGDGRPGVEALLRWKHPYRGSISPAEFIPVAEDSGLIVPIGRLVLLKATAQLAAWRRELGALAPAHLAVNVSVAQLRAPQILDDFQDCLALSGIEPSALVIEVTESLAAQDELARARLEEIRALGVRIALDDFGTGYSSLACLHQLPIDIVKIDRGFVSHAEASAYHRVLIEATVRVASTLGLATVAEGIETEGQARLIRELGCGQAQGYWFSRPLTPEALAQWLKSAARGLTEPSVPMP